MPKEVKQQKNKKVAKPAPANGVKFTVMPREFRKAPPKRKIPPKFLIIGGGVLGLLIIVVVAVVVISTRGTGEIAKQPTPPVSEPTPTPKATTTPEVEPSLTQPKATTTKEAPVVITTKSVLVQGTDSDADGLTEKEEAIFQTDSKRPDTDSDGFLDGNEVFHLYNPSAIAPVDLVISGIVKVYRNASEGYSIYYPALWSTSSTSNTSMVSFLAKETESINVTVKKSLASITLRSWYLEEFPNADINKLQSYTSKEGYQGLEDSDRLNTYIKQGSKVFIINYTLGKTNTIWYRRLYDMMLNSFKIE